MDSEMKYPGPWLDTVEETRLFLKVCEWRYQRPVVRQEKCCYCGTCYLFCPTGCIRSMETYFDADLAFCKGCGICARGCPVQAIRMVPEGYE